MIFVKKIIFFDFLFLGKNDLEIMFGGLFDKNE